MKKTYLDELYTAKDKANKALDALDSWRLKDIAHEDKYTNEAKRKVIQMHINALENLIQIYIDTHKSGITDRTDEPKVDTSRFRVVDGELLALKEPPTFEQWRDKNFAQRNNPYIWEAKKSSLKFTEQELIKIWELLS